MSLFASEYEALIFAYRAEDRPVIKLSSAFTGMVGATKVATDMTPQDWIAQAGMIVGRVRQELHGEDLMIVEGSFCSAATHEGRRLKKELISPLVLRLQASRKKQIDVWYMADVIRGWSGARRHHDEYWWSKHLKVHLDTLRRWRKTEDEARPGLEVVLDDWLRRVVYKLNASFVDAQWIPGD